MLQQLTAITISGLTRWLAYSPLNYWCSPPLTRSKEQPPHTPTPTDTEAHPEFKTSQIPGKMTARASARTYFYKDEEKCDQTMKHFLSCIETAGEGVWLLLV